jgi:CheY-like chemotaxis protein
MGHRILLADDSITVQKIVKLTFSDEGVEVIAVGNGEQAVQQLRELRPDLVMADVFMPGKDGYEVCEYIKTHPELRHTPVILLVHAFEPFDQERAIRVGADCHLTKPFQSIRALVATVKELIQPVSQSAAYTAAASASSAPEAAPVPSDPETDFEAADTAPLAPAAASASGFGEALDAGTPQSPAGAPEPFLAPFPLEPLPLLESTSAGASEIEISVSTADTEPLPALEGTSEFDHASALSLNLDAESAPLDFPVDTAPLAQETQAEVGDEVLELEDALPSARPMHTEELELLPEIATALHDTATVSVDEPIAELPVGAGPPPISEDPLAAFAAFAPEPLPILAEVEMPPSVSDFDAPAFAEAESMGFEADSAAPAPLRNDEAAGEDAEPFAPAEVGALPLTVEAAELKPEVILEPSLATEPEMFQGHHFDSGVGAVMETGMEPGPDTIGYDFAAADQSGEAVFTPEEAATSVDLPESEPPSSLSASQIEQIEKRDEGAGIAVSPAEGLNGHAIPAALIDEIARRVVERLSEKAIQEIAWEVVPEMAELLIRRQLAEKVPH